MADTMSRRSKGVTTQRYLSMAQIRFALALSLTVIVTHAIAYLLHEYAHAASAWALGWMAAPFDIDYGPRTLYNRIFLGDVSDNVDYARIFAAGHGVQAAFIALAGVFVGNGVVYALCYAVLRWLRVSLPAGLAMAIYGLALMSAGNVWSYVPIRTITTHADMAIAAQGLGVSPLLLCPFLLLPALFVVYHFHRRMLPLALAKVAGGSRINMAVLIVITAYWYFCFFGDDGTSGRYGLVSQGMSIASVYFIFPLSAMYFLTRYCLGASSVRATD